MTNSRKKGTFIVFEGIGCSGKSTQSKLLAEHLKERGVPVLWNREPTDGPFGSLIRSLIKEERNAVRHIELFNQGYKELPELEARKEEFGLHTIQEKILRGEELIEVEFQTLFVCDRLHDLINTIIPHYEKGGVIVQDRYDLSTFSHGIADGVSYETIHGLQKSILGLRYISPDACVFIDVSPGVARERLMKRGDVMRYDEEDRMRRIISAYRELFENMKHEDGHPMIAVISGEDSIEVIQEEIQKALKGIL